MDELDVLRWRLGHRGILQLHQESALIDNPGASGGGGEHGATRCGRVVIGKLVGAVDDNPSGRNDLALGDLPGNRGSHDAGADDGVWIR